jgi:hypothetical protein
LRASGAGSGGPVWSGQAWGIAATSGIAGKTIADTVGSTGAICTT